jgi:hypothetical protein
VSNKLYVQLYGKDVTSERLRGTTRSLTSAAIGEVLNRVYDVLIWLMSANAMFQQLTCGHDCQLPHLH